MKTLSATISSKSLQSLTVLIGIIFYAAAWYVYQSTSNTTEYLFRLQDIHIESFASQGMDPNQVILNGETLRDIASKYTQGSLFGTIGMAIAGSLFLLLAFVLSAFKVRIGSE
ncbi:hypothetical protein DRW07_02775 [Alteromonas sediminis]|uniref:Uncharacterized protein n=1 Tax=Alteromonas sediminis TaxID=2259342 RepID=A0A3N5Y4B4_9ALTE|nr:hypothetical protein [Alteromonas sediminis]RPJ68350.1 hypothetical protein DRW07_02775 [Alteromonas sediminis]